jgi:hypothetical protein
MCAATFIVAPAFHAKAFVPLTPRLKVNLLSPSTNLFWLQNGQWRMIANDPETFLTARTALSITWLLVR